MPGEVHSSPDIPVIDPEYCFTCHHSDLICSCPPNIPKTYKMEPSFDEVQSFQDADHGFIDRLDPCIIKDGSGRIVWDNEIYNFLSEPVPETASPKLWRQAQLVAKQGLYKVVDGIYQIRGSDLSNMTVIEGTKGIIVIDPLTSVECAKAALELYRKNRGNKAVNGMLYTHSHADHFGGAEGILSRSEATQVPVIAPHGFLEHAVMKTSSQAMLWLAELAICMETNCPKVPGPRSVPD